MNNRTRPLLILAAALVVLTSCGEALSATAGKKLTMIFADFSERAGLVFVAKDQHFFDEQGIDMEVVQVRSGPVAIAALAASEAQFYMVSATASTLGAMASGLDLAFIAGLVNKLDGYFVANSKIRVPEDLKGKVLGVQSIGGGIWMFAQMALDHWGINPDRDKIQVRVIGDQSVLAQAMTSGLIDASVLGYAFSQVVRRGGGHILAELPKLNIPYQGSGLVARRSFVSGSPDMVEKTLRALLKANQFIQEKRNEAAVLTSLRKWLRLPAGDSGEELYDRMRLLYGRRIEPSREGIQNALRVLSKADPKYAKIRAEDLIDDRIVRKLD